jgi:phage major head subunit gpT-like protein
MSAAQGGRTTSGDLGRLIERGVNAVINQKNKMYDAEYQYILDVKNSEKAYETDVPFGDFGVAKVKNKGASLEYDDMLSGNSKIYQHVTYALGAQIEWEAMQDDLYQDLSVKAGNGLSKALNQTKEITAANVFNNGYSSTKTWDGENLFSTGHKLLKGGTMSNMLATAAPLSEAAIEDACIAISRFVDDGDRIIKVLPMSLHIAPENQFVAQRILGSTLQNDTANNATNALRDMGKFPKGTFVNHFFTNGDNWFIRTDVEDGGKLFLRNPNPITGMDDDFGTSDYRHKIMQRWSQGVSDFRQYFGSGDL